MKDNPYAAAKDSKSDRDPSITKEIDEWRNAKREKEKKLRLLIFGIMILLVVLSAFLIAIF